MEPFSIGADGKRYPAYLLPAEHRAELVDTVHHLAHAEHYSQRKIQRALAAVGIRRSLGTIANYLAQPCAECCQWQLR